MRQSFAHFHRDKKSSGSDKEWEDLLRAKISPQDLVQDRPSSFDDVEIVALAKVPKGQDIPTDIELIFQRKITAITVSYAT